MLANFECSFSEFVYGGLPLRCISGSRAFGEPESCEQTPLTSVWGQRVPHGGSRVKEELSLICLWSGLIFSRNQQPLLPRTRQYRFIGPNHWSRWPTCTLQIGLTKEYLFIINSCHVIGFDVQDAENHAWVMLSEVERVEQKHEIGDVLSVFFFCRALWYC